MLNNKVKRRVVRKRPGRNVTCPCGSGLKYKKCHGSVAQAMPSPEKMAAAQQRHEAKEALRRHQQGEGKPIISAEVADHRIVAVGNRVYFGKNQRTFIDFLDNYIRATLGADWGEEELQKPLRERHQILQWYEAVCAYQKKYASQPKGEIQSSPKTGLMLAYYGLAYNLYLLQHNAELQAFLIRRLKRSDHFYAAYYETFVAAWFIVAGFELALENEQDTSTTHVEFIATRAGRSYSVEAKARLANKNNYAVSNQLYKALRKKSKHRRFVFIDANVGGEIDPEDFREQVTASVRRAESRMTIHGNPAPPAYVFVTNQPYHLRLDDESVPRVLLCLGFKIPDFGSGIGFSSLIAAHRAREKHVDAHSLQDAFKNFDIPTTFDGEITEFAFGEAKRRFQIGQVYQIEQGVSATLTTDWVVQGKGTVYLCFQTEDGKFPILTAELTDSEMAAYRTHPETFFGRILKQGGQLEQPIDLFDFFLRSYREAPKKRLLEFMKDAPDIEDLERLPEDDLRLIYAERLTHSLFAKKAK